MDIVGSSRSRVSNRGIFHELALVMGEQELQKHLTEPFKNNEQYKLQSNDSN